jgi:hypothetical protein
VHAPSGWCPSGIQVRLQDLKVKLAGDCERLMQAVAGDLNWIVLGIRLLEQEAIRSWSVLSQATDINVEYASYLAANLEDVRARHFAAIGTMQLNYGGLADRLTVVEEAVAGLLQGRVDRTFEFDQALRTFREDASQALQAIGAETRGAKRTHGERDASPSRRGTARRTADRRERSVHRGPRHPSSDSSPTPERSGEERSMYFRSVRGRDERRDRDRSRDGRRS